MRAFVKPPFATLRVTAAALLVVAAVTVGAARPASAFLDKTRFVAHVGVAYFAFHHWVLHPYEEGAFSAGAPHRTSAMVKGGIALVFAVHELEVAERIAHDSKDPLLQRIDGGVRGLASSFAAAGHRLASGSFDPAQIDGLARDVAGVGATAAQNGTPIKDVPVHVPGL